MGRTAMKATIPLDVCPLCGAAPTYRKTEKSKICHCCESRVARVRGLTQKMPTNAGTAVKRLEDVLWLKKNLVVYVELGHRVPGWLTGLEQRLRNQISSLKKDLSNL